MASAVALIIGSSVVQAAITLVDACTGFEFTGAATFPALSGLVLDTVG
jgi:hypothetical protein